MDWNARQDRLKNWIKLIALVVFIVACVITVVVRHSTKAAERSKKIADQFAWYQQRVAVKPELKGLTVTLEDPDDGPIRVTGAPADKEKVDQIHKLLEYPVEYACNTLIEVDLDALRANSRK